MKRFILISLLSFGLVSLFQMPMVIADDDDDGDDDDDNLRVSDIVQKKGLRHNKRLEWGKGNNAASSSNSSSRSQVRLTSPPGAPELPAPMMFGSGLAVLGFGLILTRRLW